MEPRTIKTKDALTEITVSVENDIVCVDLEDSEKLNIAWLLPEQARELLNAIARAYLAALKESRKE